MALTLGNPTLTTAARSAMASNIGLDAFIETGGGDVTITYVLSSGPTTLATFLLDGTNAFTESNGVLTMANAPRTDASADAGSADTPDEWHLFNRASTEVMSGPITGTGPITAGDTVNLNSLTITVPAS